MYPAAADSSVAESTATESMLNAISAMESAAVVAAGMVITGMAVRAAVVTITNAACQNDDGGHRQKREERPLPLTELRRWFASFRAGLFVGKFMMFHC